MPEQAAASMPVGGVSAAELVARDRRYGHVGQAELERWLVSERLAVVRGGRLYPTRLGRMYGTIVARASRAT